MTLNIKSKTTRSPHFSQVEGPGPKKRRRAWHGHIFTGYSNAMCKAFLYHFTKWLKLFPWTPLGVFHFISLAPSTSHYANVKYASGCFCVFTFNFFVTLSQVTAIMTMICIAQTGFHIWSEMLWMAGSGFSTCHTTYSTQCSSST